MMMVLFQLVVVPLVARLAVDPVGERSGADADRFNVGVALNVREAEEQLGAGVADLERAHAVLFELVADDAGGRRRRAGGGLRGARPLVRGD